MLWKTWKCSRSKKPKKGEWVYVFEGRIEKPNLNKNEQGGISTFNDKPRCATLWNRNQLNGQLNIFNDLTKYIHMTKKVMKIAQDVIWRLTIL